MECDEIKDALGKGDEELRSLLDFLYQPQNPYAKAAKRIWLRYQSKEKVQRLFPNWRDLFWETFNHFADRVTKDQIRARLKSLEETIGSIEDEQARKAIESEIEAASRRKWKDPVRDCLQYFSSLCYFLCIGALKDKVERLPLGEIQIKEENAYSEAEWAVMEYAINNLSETCRKLLIVRFYYKITDLDALSAVTGGKVSPSSIGATITECKRKLKFMVAGIDLDDFE